MAMLPPSVVTTSPPPQPPPLPLSPTSRSSRSPILGAPAPAPVPAPPLLELFEGDDSYPVGEFIAMAEYMMSSHADYYVTAARRIGYASNNFSGRARLWFTYILGKSPRPHCLRSWDEFRTALLQYFGDVDPVPHTVLLRLTQEDNDVVWYAKEFREKAAVCRVAVDHEYYRRWFVLGLQPAIRDRTLRALYHLGTFQDVVRHAREIEVALLAVSQPHTAHSSHLSRTRAHTPTH